MPQEMTLNATRPLGALKQILRRAEAPPWQATYQLVIGFFLVPLFARLRSRDAPDWHLLPFFLLVLVALRIISAIVRRSLPFSSDLQTRWSRQRLLAKRYDSYQWRKLFWFGLGLSSYVALFERAGSIPGFLALVCLLSGALGALAWRRLARRQELSAFPSVK